MAVKDPILIPYWVASAFKRKQLPLSNLLNYKMVRQVLSLEDVAMLLNFQQLRAVDFLNRPYDSCLLSSWNKSCDDLRNELDSTVVQLSHSKQMEERNLFRLKPDYLVDQQWSNDCLTMDTSTNQEVFELNDFERESYGIVIYPGFVQAIEQYECKLNLVKAMLKISYVYLDKHKVSSNGIFATYVSLLNDKVWGRVFA